MQIASVNFLADMPFAAQPPGDARIPSTPAVRLPGAGHAAPEESEALTQLRNSLAEHDISLKFSKDAATNALVVQMIDEKTGEEIRQFPTQVSLNLAANFIRLQGQFVDRS